MTGTFYGLGVGPGPYGLLPVTALEILQTADLIYAPRSRVSPDSVALAALDGLPFPRDRVREVEFLMDGDDTRIGEHYAALAHEIAAHQRAGRSVAYLTIGDAMTYSTLGYLVAALTREAPDLPRRVFPGVTSYATAAALTGFSLGEGKERVLILPCPDDMAALRADILVHDVVALMKVGRRMADVLALLQELGIAEHCALAHRLGLDGEVVLPSLAPAPDPGRLGYLSVVLIRREAPRRFA
ncbi:precorrin-2 C(20)-methyltransferase [Deinococcus phoenicis]|uniref:Precorrin-2 C(20)-methyltransferase n=1 Tax=Deinococcus phoenicis TaxID=1476583 RepID=A0A016QT84_9DEIO|nr:precorrin-2 C(20)-methyltransferase [Deinococcus phoenicis]EYB68999.1 precorrin-2 C(20)-methyltransferase [Deinococcus phoenicis]